MQRRRRSLLIALATAVVAVLAFAACDPSPPPPNAPQATAAAKNDLLARHTYLRSINGLQPFASNGALANYAQYHADRMAAGATRCNIWHSGEAYSWYAGYTWGENVACVPGCPSDGGQAFNMWLNSPGHAANIFKPQFALIGVGVACSWSVQMSVTHFRSP